jgi:SAM-dependent methyltransferase
VPDDERDLASAMAATAADPDTQLSQTRHRMSLVDGWGIPAGASVLELGCGQGDTTAALAAAVGPAGRVVAVDPAGPDYGSPVTLGESAEFLRASAVGDRIDFRLGFDVLDQADHFADDAFDYVVLAHCSWYFESFARLRDTLGVVRSWAPALCFAEWEPRPTDVRQLPHLLAVLLQGHAHASGIATGGNVRMPFSREALSRVLAETGWRTVRQRAVDTAGLADADWEIDACLRLAPLLEAAGEFPRSQLDVLRSVAAVAGNRALPAYQVLARRD